MGPGAPDVGGAVLLLLDVACQFVLVTALYWRLALLNRVVAGWTGVGRHAVGLVFGMIVSLSAAAVSIVVAKSTGVSLLIVTVLLTIPLVYVWVLLRIRCVQSRKLKG